MRPLLPYLQYDSTTTAGSTGSTAMAEIWKSSGYAFIPFKVQTTGLEFDFSKRSIAAAAEPRAQTTSSANTNTGTSIAASNLAVAWSANGLNDGIIGGVLQGRKKLDIKGASAVSRRKLWSLALQIAENFAAQETAVRSSDGSGSGRADLLIKYLSNQEATYDEIKESSLMRARQAVKREARREALKGWIRNVGDGGFRLSDP